MIKILLDGLRLATDAVTEEGTSKQLALGLAMGLVVGLVPKGNLTAVLLLTVLCSLRLNLAAGLASVALFSWVSLLTDPFANWIGRSLLEWPLLVPAWTWLYGLPVVPWTAFNNTAVMGNLVLGLILVYPVYRLSEPQIEKHLPKILETLKKSYVIQALAGLRLAARWRNS